MTSDNRTTLEWEPVIIGGHRANSSGVDVRRLRIEGGWLYATERYRINAFHEREVTHMATIWVPFTEIVTND